MSPPRDKKLKNTMSWSTNALIKLYHSHAQLKQQKPFPQFIEEVKANEAVQKWQAQGVEQNEVWRIERSGYVTYLDNTAKPATADDEEMTQTTSN